MAIVVKPKEGIGAVRLGMRREVVRAGVAGPVTVMRHPFATTDTDHFTSLGIQVNYDDNDLCNFITATARAAPTLETKVITGIPFSECRSWFERLDEGLELDETGLVSKKLGIVIYAEAPNIDPSDPVQAVSVFADGYFD